MLCSDLAEPVFLEPNVGQREETRHTNGNMYKRIYMLFYVPTVVGKHICQFAAVFRR
jgi:hypothetical protein